MAAPTKPMSAAKVTPRTLASGSPACGNVDTKQAIMDPACDDATADATPAKIETRTRTARVSSYLGARVAQPTTAKRAVQPVATPPAARLALQPVATPPAARLALQPVATPPAARLAPRTLNNGRPACGNLGGKAPAMKCDPATGSSK
jgi:hypothetical protein